MNTQDEEFERRFWANIERALEQRGWRWADLSRCSGLTEQRLSKYRGGQGRVSLRYAAKLAQALDVPVEALIGTAELPPPRRPDELMLYRFVFGGSAPLGVDEALRLIQVGLRAEAAGLQEQLGPATIPPETKTPRAAPPSHGEVTRGPNNASKGRGR